MNVHLHKQHYAGIPMQPPMYLMQQGKLGLKPKYAKLSRSHHFATRANIIETFSALGPGDLSLFIGMHWQAMRSSPPPPPPPLHPHSGLL